MVEEVEKSEEQKTNDASKHRGVRSDGEEEERRKEGGENGGGGDTSPRPGKDITKRHPLEHSWTFWFDNPSAKSKQVAWGSSIRPIYTFSTVEEFWRYVYVSEF